MAHQSRCTDVGNFLMTVEVLMIVFMVIIMMIHNAKRQTFVITVDVHLMAALSWCLQLSGPFLLLDASLQRKSQTSKCIHVK